MKSSPFWNNLVKRTGTGLLLVLVLWLTYAYLPPIILSALFVGILWHILHVEWPRLFDDYSFSGSLFALCYPLLPFVFLIQLNSNPNYHHLLGILFIIVWSHDTGSYLVGNTLGKHKIAPLISPGKTWEGFFGGYCIAIICLITAMHIQGITKPLLPLFALTFITCLLSLAGDLFESWLKRRAEVKDSGTILPGHGGFLDRFDGLMIAGTFFYLCRSYLIQFF